MPAFSERFFRRVGNGGFPFASESVLRPFLRSASPDMFCASRSSSRSGASRTRSGDAFGEFRMFSRLGDVRARRGVRPVPPETPFCIRSLPPEFRHAPPFLRYRPFDAAPLRRIAPPRITGRSRRRRRTAPGLRERGEDAACSVGCRRSHTGRLLPAVIPPAGPRDPFRARGPWRRAEPGPETVR